MAQVTNRRLAMIMFNSHSIRCHTVRIVLAEKGINYDSIMVSDERYNEELAEINPYNETPTLVDRDLALYGQQVIVEYLDERFPHPPLMPVDPVTRAQFRLALFRIETDWYSIAEEAENSNDGKLGTRSRKMLRESILQSIELFGARPYFLSEEFSLVDCTIAPLLWRLPAYGVDLGADAEAIEEYMNRVFARRSFQQSLTELEQEMRL